MSMGMSMRNTFVRTYEREKMDNYEYEYEEYQGEDISNRGDG